VGVQREVVIVFVHIKLLPPDNRILNHHTGYTVRRCLEPLPTNLKRDEFIILTAAVDHLPIVIEDGKLG
jgi:hypothetical protein